MKNDMGPRTTQQFCVRIDSELVKKLKIFGMIETRTLEDLTTQALQEFVDRRYKIPKPTEGK
jgi:predicted transcriptional regulator